MQEDPKSLKSRMAKYTNTELRYEDLQKEQADRYNNSTGKLTGYDCPECKNRGDFLEIENGNFAVRQCACMSVRKCISNIEQSGLKSLMERCSFDNYIAKTEWQKDILQAAKKYIKNPSESWFIGGNSGSGKTHICTAIVGDLLNRGFPARYMLWTKESRLLKANINEDEEFERLIRPLQNVKFLYVDDFLRVPEGGKTSDADIKIAWEIINYRYCNRLETIISSEKMLHEIIDMDESLGSRIKEMVGEYCFGISRDRDKNYRLGGLQ